MYYVADWDSLQHFLLDGQHIMCYNMNCTEGREVPKEALLLPCMEHMREVNVMSILINRNGMSEVAVLNKQNVFEQKYKCDYNTAVKLLSEKMSEDSTTATLLRNVCSGLQQAIIVTD